MRFLVLALLAFAEPALATPPAPPAWRARLQTVCARSVDLSNQIGPVRNQGHASLCYAFTAVNLYQQYACRNQLPECVLKDAGGFSVMDAVLSLPGTPRHLLKGQGNHIVTVAGARQQGNRCQLKILNSWGADWQTEHQGGWVDAETLFRGAKQVEWIEGKAPYR